METILEYRVKDINGCLAPGAFKCKVKKFDFTVCPREALLVSELENILD